MRSRPDFAARLANYALERDIETEYVLTLIERNALIAPPDAGPAWPFRLRVRLLGEDMVAFRDSDGRVGLVTQPFGRLPDPGLRLRRDLETTQGIADCGGRQAGVLGDVPQRRPVTPFVHSAQGIPIYSPTS